MNLLGTTEDLENLSEPSSGLKFTFMFSYTYVKGIPLTSAPGCPTSITQTSQPSHCVQPAPRSAVLGNALVQTSPPVPSSCGRVMGSNGTANRGCFLMSMQRTMAEFCLKKKKASKWSPFCQLGSNINIIIERKGSKVNIQQLFNVKQLSTKEENFPLLSVANLIKGIKFLEETTSNALQ